MMNTPRAVFTKGLRQVLGLSWLYFYTKLKPKTWLRPFVNTAPGVYVFVCLFVYLSVCLFIVFRLLQN